MAVVLATGIAALSLAATSTVWAKSFNFTLSESSKTSAGVFKPDGTLIKTIWSGVTYGPGTYTKEWDGTDDNGRLAPDGSYQIRVLSSQMHYQWDGVVGNTSTNNEGPGVFHFMSTISGMAIAGTRAYIATGYEEGTSAQARFDTANPGGRGEKTEILWKGAQFQKVATDGTRVYWAGDDPTRLNDGFVIATWVANDLEVVFSEGVKPYVQYAAQPYDNKGAIDADCGDYLTNCQPSGLAVQKLDPDHGFLFVAHRGQDSVHVLDKITGAPVNEQPIMEPGDLAVDGSDNLWVIHTVGSQRKVQKFTVDAYGTLTADDTPTTETDIAQVSNALALAWSGSTLLVTDGGSSQQVKGYDASGTRLWTVGSAGGYLNNPDVTDYRFDFEPDNLEYTNIFQIYGNTAVPYQSNGTFLAAQPDGSFWVGDTGSYRAQHYSAAGVFIDRVAYIPAFYSVAADPNDPTRVSANFLEYHVNYDLPLGGTNGSWTLKRNWRASASESSGSWVWMFTRMKYLTTLRHGGEEHTYAAVRGYLFELTPAGLKQTTTVLGGGSISADGYWRWAEPDGTVETWKQQQLDGFVEVGINDPVTHHYDPVWSPMVTTLASAPIKGLEPYDRGDFNDFRIGNVTTGGVLISYDYMRQGRLGWHLGGVRVGVGATDWLWKASHATPTNYAGDWPTDGSFDIGWLVGGIPGGAVMTVDRHVIYAYRGGWRDPYNSLAVDVNMYRHFYEDGLFVDEFGVIGDGTGNASLGMAINALNNWLVKLPDGRVYMYHNDESSHAGVHRWRIDGLGSVSEDPANTTNIDLRQDLQPGLQAEYFDTPDWNNRHLKATRLEPQVVLDWATGVPPALGLTHNEFSVRWSGYVLPEYSAAYQFTSDVQDGARVWVDGQLVLPYPDPSHPLTVALSAGVYTPIRVEYRGNTAAAAMTLMWSRPSLSEQPVPVPGEWLAFAAPGTDLMDGLPASGPVAAGIAGWNRVPTEDDYSDYFHRWFVDTEENNGNSRLSVFYYNSTPGTVSTVTRDLGTPSDTTARWELNMSVSYEGSYINHQVYGGQYLEVLDEADKVVARFYPGMVAYPNDGRFFGNGATIVQGGVYDVMYAIMPPRRPLQISAEDGQVTFRYDSYPAVTTPVFDPEANWRRIKTLRVYFWTDPSGGYERRIKIDGLRLNTVKSQASVQSLMATLPPNGAVANDPTDPTVPKKGWNRVPAEDDYSDYFHRWFVDVEANNGNPYLSVIYWNSTPGTVSTVTRDLGAPSDATARWELNMNLSYEGSYINHQVYGGQFLEVLDDAGKVLARFYPGMVAYPNDGRVFGNGATIVQGGVYDVMYSIMPPWRPLRISAEGGQITFKYGDYNPVTTPILDPTANWRRPKTFRLYYWTDPSGGYMRTTKVDDLQFTVNGASVPVDLLAGLPWDSLVASGDYGWSFTPAQSYTTQFEPTPIWAEWHLMTNRMTWDRSPPFDIGAHYFVLNGTASLSRDLGDPSDSTSRWELTAQISYAGGYPNHDTSGGQYLEILDDAQPEPHVVARFYPQTVFYPDDARMIGNDADTPITKGSTGELWHAIMPPWRPLRISAEQGATPDEGRVTFQYGDYNPVTTGILNPAANWRRAKTLRLYYFTNNPGGAYDRRCHLNDLKFSVTK